MSRRWLLPGCLLMIVTSMVHAAPNPPNAIQDRPSLDLSGEWEFKLDPLDIGREQKWFEDAMPFERTVRVPGAWNAQGVAFESDQHLRAYEAKRLEEDKALTQLGIQGQQRESARLFHVYPGPGWYRKRVTIPPEWTGKVPWLVFGGAHREAEVWVNGRPAGAHHSYLTPFHIDLSQHATAGETVTIVARVDARRRRDVDPLMGCLDTLDFLYVSWGGLHRPVRLEAVGAARVEDVFVVPRLAAETAEIRVAIERDGPAPLAIDAEVFDAAGASVGSVREAVAGDATGATLAVRIAGGAKRWSPRSPHLYTARLRLLSGGEAIDARSVRFGMREFKVEGGRFLLNGKPIFLRGYGDDCIFPDTICPPADKAEFRRRLALAREYGFNYVRHHSWTPPEEYLDAADELGMMLQPEFPFAYRWDLPATPEAKRSARGQWEAMIRLHRNHPSIVVWCMGNELYDSFDEAPQWYRSAKDLDPTRPVIDSDGVRFRHKDRATLDFLVAQFAEGNSIGFGDGKYDIPADVGKPVVGHEMGYFVTLHDLTQLDLFKNGLRPYWLEQTRDLARRNDVLDAYPDWLAASYRLQAESLKTNMEAARRSRLSGTSVWLFQDYPNCAEGIVDMFHRPKGISGEAFRRFNAPTVLLLDVPRRNWWGGEAVDLRFAVSRFEDDPSDDATLRWELKSGTETVASGVRERLRITADGVQALEAARLTMPSRTRAERLTLSAELVDHTGTTSNSWDLWVFPRAVHGEAPHKVRARGFDALRKVYPAALESTDRPAAGDTDLLVTMRLDRGARDYLEAGGRVILLDPEPAFDVEPTNFRLSSWDGGGPSGTIFDRGRPALRDMPSEGWCDLQFYPLIQGSKSILLTRLPERINPLVRCIDRPTRLADRAYLFEASVGRGRLLVSGFNFAGAIETGDPAAAFLLESLIRYAAGPDFAPRVSIPPEAFNDAPRK